MILHKRIVLLIMFLTIVSCSSDSTSDDGLGLIDVIGFDTGGNGVSGTWSIPKDEVIDSGAGKDGIPSIDNPVFIDGNDTRVNTYMKDEDLIVGIVIDGEIKAYPHRVLDWHEIVNDEINGEKITLSYCPLTGSALAWERVINNRETTFGVSGLLYNSNLILYDRETNSHWSQLLFRSVNGSLMHKIPKLYDIQETTWKRWKEMYPSTKILSNEQGFDRDYNVYPYGGYKKDDAVLLFPLSKKDEIIDYKERVHALVYNNNAMVYRFINFIGGKVFKETFITDTILVVGDDTLLRSFVIDNQHLNLEFQYDDSKEYLFKDNEGNRWSSDGEAIIGPRKGEKLTPTNSLMTYWLAVPPFFENIEIHQ